MGISGKSSRLLRAKYDLNPSAFEIPPLIDRFTVD